MEGHYVFSCLTISCRLFKINHELMEERKKNIYKICYVKSTRRWNVAFNRAGNTNVIFSADTKEACEKMITLNMNFPFKND